jgi:hypothetical protein
VLIYNDQEKETRSLVVLAPGADVSHNLLLCFSARSLPASHRAGITYSDGVSDFGSQNNRPTFLAGCEKNQALKRGQVFG